MVDARRRINFIGKIKRDNRLLVDPVQINKDTAQLFENIHFKEDVVRPMLDGVDFPLIKEDMKVWLEREFEEKEISKALADCARVKRQVRMASTSPLSRMLGLLSKRTSVKCSLGIFTWGMLNKEINATFMCLIPKISNPMD